MIVKGKKFKMVPFLTERKEVLTFEKAKEYRNSYGRYLRRNQWRDIEIEVWMVI